MSRSTPASVFAILLGCFLLIQGIWGLIDPPVFGVLGTNTLQAILHIVLAIIGLCMGVAGRGRNYLISAGMLFAIAGLCYFIPATRSMVLDLLNINKIAAILNIGITAVSFLMVGLSRHQPGRYRY